MSFAAMDERRHALSVPGVRADRRRRLDIPAFLKKRSF